MTIVTTTYRYKPPPKRKGRKLAKITGPAVVTQKNGRRLGETAAEAGEIQPVPAGTRTGRRQSTTARASGGDHIPANDDRKSAIVTARPRSRSNSAPDMTPEEHCRRGYAAAAMFREMTRQIAALPKKP